MNRTILNVLIVLAACFAGTDAQSALSGSAETVSCSAPWGGVSGNCSMSKTVEQLIPGVLSIPVDNFDRLTWDCKVYRDTIVYLAGNTVTDIVPPRNIGGTWNKTVTVNTHEQLPAREYCTINRSIFWYRASSSTTPNPVYYGPLQNAVDITECKMTPNQGGGPDN